MTLPWSVDYRGMCDLVQEDIGRRGLRNDPNQNLITQTQQHLDGVCDGFAIDEQPEVAIITGFFIPLADPPAGETDGPLGAVFLARAMDPLGWRVTIASDAFCVPALRAGLDACGLADRVPIVTLPSPERARGMTGDAYYKEFLGAAGKRYFPYLLAIERVGPNHTPTSLAAQERPAHALDTLWGEFRQQVPPEARDRCYTMRGVDISDRTSPAHLLFDAVRYPSSLTTTIGIGDGGNEIGMGAIPWEVIQRNIDRGGLISCRVPTDYLIVAGISNWGAYALAAGVYGVRRVMPADDVFDPTVERRILEAMVEAGPLVDGVLGRRSVTVDGVSWDRYAGVLPRLHELLLRG
jgi:hypothetical protein